MAKKKAAPIVLRTRITGMQFLQGKNLQAIVATFVYTRSINGMHWPRTARDWHCRSLIGPHMSGKAASR